MQVHLQVVRAAFSEYLKNIVGRIKALIQNSDIWFPTERFPKPGHSA